MKKAIRFSQLFLLITMIFCDTSICLSCAEYSLRPISSSEREQQAVTNMMELLPPPVLITSGSEALEVLRKSTPMTYDQYMAIVRQLFFNRPELRDYIYRGVGGVPVIDDTISRKAVISSSYFPAYWGPATTALDYAKQTGACIDIGMVFETVRRDQKPGGEAVIGRVELRDITRAWICYFEMVKKKGDHKCYLVEVALPGMKNAEALMQPEEAAAQEPRPDPQAVSSAV